MTPLGWSLPVGIGIVMFGAAMGVGDRSGDLHPAIDEAIEMLHVAPPDLRPLSPDLIAVTDLQKSCEVEVTAQPLATAVVELEILAVCDAGQTVTVRHEGLRIAAILDDRGRAIVTLPALRADPSYLIEVSGRSPTVTTAATLDFDGYKRTVLLAAPDTGFELHAYEGGSGFGEAGHVQPTQPYDPVRALVGSGGFLSKIGTPSLLGSGVAQVYTAPQGTASSLSLEAEVTEANCGRGISALTIQPRVDAEPALTSWQLDMPGCDSVGEIILLGTISP